MAHRDGCENIISCIEALRSKDATAGYAAFGKLVDISRNSDAVYPYIEQFVEMAESADSYRRTRALGLIAANARWDTDCVIEKNIDAILAHITDCKPITARQFIKTLPTLARFKPDLREHILTSLRSANTLRYPLSMRSLVDADIRGAIADIVGCQLR